jgi:hypothetical protein
LIQKQSSFLHLLGSYSLSTNECSNNIPQS